MRSGKKFTLGLLPTFLAIVAMLLAGCGGPQAAQKPQAAPATQQTLRVALGGISDIATFDPALSTDVDSASAIDMVFTGLVQENDKLEVTAQMAQSWSVSSDGLTYTFHLRPNLKFSDGTPLTAQDVAYSIDRALSKPINDQTGVSSTYLGLIKDSAQRLDGSKSTLIGDSINPDVANNTISLTVDHVTGYFLEALTYPTAYVVEKSLIDKWGTNWTDHLSTGGGDGPFQVSNYNHSTGITFVPNPNYYGKSQTLKKVEFLFYKDTETAYKAYQANQVDQVGVPTNENATAMKNTAEYHEIGQLTIFYVAMNYLYKPFDNIDIRQAFELAVNKDVIAKNIQKDLATPTCHIVPQGMPGYDQGLKCPQNAPTKGDPTKAKQLFQEGMQQEGYTLSSFPSITITYPSGDQPTADQITTMVQAWQSILGITVKTQAVDFTTLLGDVTASACQTPDSPQKCLNKGLQMWWLGWIADYPDPQDWTTLQFAKGVSNNDWNYGQNFSSDAAQQVATQNLLEKADIDLGKDRLSLYNQAEQQLANDVAWMPLFQADAAVLIKKYVYGVVLNAQGITPPDDWANIYIAVH